MQERVEQLRLHLLIGYVPFAEQPHPGHQLFLAARHDIDLRVAQPDVQLHLLVFQFVKPCNRVPGRGPGLHGLHQVADARVYIFQFFFQQPDITFFQSSCIVFYRLI
ncbi:MAG: hypothetical protein J5923_02460, partial [Acidaminococcaceae bacterium]|nr:hypothetical protein [Acidaminococcaceae bacterium]